MNPREQIEALFGQIEKTRGDDRLARLNLMLRMRGVISAALQSLSPLQDPELAAEYSDRDLAEIIEILDAGVGEMRRLMEWFLTRVEGEDRPSYSV